MGGSCFWDVKLQVDGNRRLLPKGMTTILHSLDCADVNYYRSPNSATPFWFSVYCDYDAALFSTGKKKWCFFSHFSTTL